jgi:hypothetical protein
MIAVSHAEMLSVSLAGWVLASHGGMLLGRLARYDPTCNVCFCDGFLLGLAEGFMVDYLVGF